MASDMTHAHWRNDRYARKKKSDVPDAKPLVAGMKKGERQMKRFVAAFIVAILGFDVMAGGKIIMLKDKIKELPAEDQKIINSIKIKKLEPAIGRYTYNSITLYASSKNIISDKISAEIYYLCQDGNKKYSVLKITAGLDFVMKG